MDPNATLAELRELSEAIDADDSADDMPEKAARFAELFQALDQWFSRGGFLPRAWSDRAKTSDGHLALATVEASKALRTIALETTGPAALLAHDALAGLVQHMPESWIE